jgi:hypothetical protein
VLGSGATLLRGIAPVPLDRPVRYGLTAPREVCFVSESRCYIDLAAVDRLPPPPLFSACRDWKKTGRAAALDTASLRRQPTRLMIAASRTTPITVRELWVWLKLM